MSSNIPSPAPSRGRLARASTSSRIPPPRRETSIPTPRRTSRTTTDLALPSAPRRDTSIPTPRRSSRTTTDPSTPPLRTPHRAASRLSTARTSSPRVPRRDEDSPAARLCAGKPARRISSAADALLPTPKRAAGVGFRRASSTHEENRNRTATPRFARAGTADTPTNRRATPRDRALPDRGTPILAAPSPARRQTSVAPAGGTRQQLKASPYARRSSAGGAGRGAISPGVSRKLNMAPTEEEENGGKRLLGLSPVTRRVSGSRGEVGRSGVADRVGARSSVAARGNATDRGFRADRVERRRDSGGGKRPGVSALESFRAARRASAEHAEAEAEEKRKADKLDMMPKPVAPSSGTDAIVAAAVGMEVMEKKETLPDRPDPILPTATMTQQRRTPAKSFRRTSGRFSDADVCLDNVEKLRSSLGRRRSHSANDGEAPETPKLRRTSLTSSFAKKEDENKDMKMSENDVPNVEMEIRNSPVLKPRSPLRSIETNRGNVLGSASPSPPFGQKNGAEVNSKRLSFVPHLDDDDAWENEDVEDLGIW